jgi:hypothetical protein
MLGLRLVLVPALVFTCGGLLAAEPDKKAVVKKAAEAVGEATRKGDVEGIVAGTYEPVIALGGGREQTIQLLRDTLKLFKILDFTVGEPSEFHAGAKNLYVIVPTTMKIEIENTKLSGKSFLLGISSDDGATWKFVDGQGISDEEERKKLLPDLPATIKLPEPEEPKIVQ